MTVSGWTLGGSAREASTAYLELLELGERRERVLDTVVELQRARRTSRHRGAAHDA